jgi:uncharacterized membrane protein
MARRAELRTIDKGGDNRELAFERIVFFSDAVFAIVITLLVLPLTGEINLPAEANLARTVLERWPSVLAFVVTFLVIGRFWAAHHRMFSFLHDYDNRLLWLNIVSLLTISFLPFPAAVLGAHTETRQDFPVVFYATSMAIASVVFTATWLYASRTSGLINESASEQELREFRLRSLATSGTFILAIGVAFIGLLPAAVFWVVVLPIARFLAVRIARRTA